jgi:hypothetical protein
MEGMRRLTLLGIVALLGVVASFVAFRREGVRNPREASRYPAWSPTRQPREAPARKVIAAPQFVERTHAPLE